MAQLQGVGRLSHNFFVKLPRNPVFGSKLWLKRTYPRAQVMKSKHRYWKLPGGRETAALCALWPVAHRGTVLRWRTAKGAAGVAEIVAVCAIASGRRGRGRKREGAVVERVLADAVAMPGEPSRSFGSAAARRRAV